MKTVNDNDIGNMCRRLIKKHSPFINRTTYGLKVIKYFSVKQLPKGHCYRLFHY